MFEALPLVVEATTDTETNFQAAERGAAHWNLSTPELARVGVNAVFNCGDVVLRVGRATAPMGKALQFAERLTAEGLRVARPARMDWLELDNGLSVTAWERIDFAADGRVDWERVGSMVAALHRIDPATVDHPLPYCATFPWWDFDALMVETESPNVDSAARRGMRRTADEFGWWADEARAAPMILCHGDVHPGNVLVDDLGPVLIDWDLLCVGPPAWDHAPLMTWTDRWGGEPGLYEAFAAGYGQMMTDDIAVAIAEMRLLAATLMRLRRGRVDPSAADEAQRRLAYWRGDSDAPMWRAQ